MNTRRLIRTCAIFTKAVRPACYLWLLLMLPATQAAPVGTGAANGNQLNPDNLPPAALPDPAGLNKYQQDLRSPTGLLYPDVTLLPALKALGESDWQYNLSVEAGFITTSNDTRPASFIEYGDWSEGPILNRFSAQLENPGTAHYAEAYGGGLGRDDQFIQLSAGRYGKYNLTLAYDAIPHVFSTNARVLWDGKGTDQLTLPSALTPGGSTLTEVQAAFQATDNSISLERNKLKMSFDFNPNRHIKFFADGTIEWRDGARPFGGTFTFPGLGQVSETIEPINYITHDVQLGLNYTGSKYQVNLAYTGSFFRNHYKTLSWENPGLTPFATLTPERGRFALAPDNDYHNIRGDFAASLPFWSSRFTASLSYNQSTQNDMLIAPTLNTGLIGNPANPVDLNMWNTVGALSRDRADAEIDAVNLHTKLIMNPIRRLRLTGEIRYHSKDNKTDYTAFNPLTGQYGYLALDGGLDGLAPSVSDIFDPARPGSRVRFRNMPFDKDSVLLSAGADYGVTNSTNLIANIEREEIHYTARELEKVIDNRFQFRLVHRKIGLGTARLSYEFSNRDGDNYNSNPYEPFYTSSLPDFISQFPDGNVLHTLSAMRKYDIAGRDSHTVNGRFNAIIGDKMDLMLTGSYTDKDYHARFGLNYSETVTANVEWNYQFALNGSVYAFYSYQHDDRKLTNINDAGLSSSNPDPGGPVYPLDRMWSEKITETNHNVGAGLNFTHDNLTFDLTYSYLYSNSRFHYDYASTAAFSNLFSAAEAGNGFPDQTYKNQLVEANLRWLVREGTNLRLLYRFEKEDLNDFHYAGLTQPVITDDIFLMAVPQNYAAHVIAVTIETSF